MIAKYIYCRVSWLEKRQRAHASCKRWQTPADKDARIARMPYPYPYPKPKPKQHIHGASLVTNVISCNFFFWGGFLNSQGPSGAFISNS